MTLTGTPVPQDVLAHASTNLRPPQTVPQALQIQEQSNKTKHYGKPKQKTRPPYKTWTWKRPQKQDKQEQKRGQRKKEKWKSILILDVMI